MSIIFNFSLEFGFRNRIIGGGGCSTRSLRSPHSTDIHYMRQMPTELQEYERLVRESIESGSCDLFRNASSMHAAVILRLFCEYAKKSVHILCGRLSEMVYGELTPYLEGAVRRGVDVRVLTVQGAAELQSKAVAEYLRSVKRLRCLGTTDDKLRVPHFALVDDKLFRIETDGEHRQAIVATNIAENETEKQEAMRLRQDAFERLWSHVPA